MTLTPHIKDVLIRAAKTFVQAFIATVSVSVGAGVDFSASSIRAIAVAAVAAGVSAGWNVIASSGTSAT